MTEISYNTKYHNGMKTIDGFMRALKGQLCLPAAFPWNANQQKMAFQHCTPANIKYQMLPNAGNEWAALIFFP